MNVFIIRYDAQYGNAADVFQHPATLVEESHIASELIDNDAFDELPVFGRLQHNATINTGKDTPAVDVAYEDNVRLCMTGHRQIHQVGSLQIDFRNTACPLHDDRVIASRQAVESIAHFFAEVDG